MRNEIVVLLCLTATAFGQRAFTWEEIRDQFLAENPTLAANRIGIDESHAQEITAHLRPNPTFTLLTDGTQLTPYSGVWRPLAGSMLSTSGSYLVERGDKRNLRLASAQGATAITASQSADQARTLVFNLRAAFNQALQSKAILAMAKESLDYYDRMLDLSRERFKAGDIAQVDLDRLELQRVQFEADTQTALVNVRTAKIQLLGLLNSSMPVDQFDISGPFDFTGQLLGLDDLREQALAARPDLRAASQAITKAKTDYRLAVANGTADPTISSWYSRNPSFNNPFDFNTIGLSASVPLRIFDRNQGEKERTMLDIRRTERLEQATRAQVLSDVDSAYATLNGNLALLRPYKSKYLKLAAQVRDTISFSYQHGGASLLDFLNAQNDYRTVQVSYLNLVGAYLNAANQLNLAVGREVIP